ncbi:hypothetical protein VNO77_26706 [Canavalia gladiata]|uniref:Uncharacterized protein n=1 Tax=Canavalia gladiata TaxID=3824 RepID=A0AAN9Q5T4_CANGL
MTIEAYLNLEQNTAHLLDWFEKDMVTENDPFNIEGVYTIIEGVHKCIESRNVEFPVLAISSTIFDVIGLEGIKVEDTDSVDGSMTEYMEHIFNSSTQLRYGHDLNLNKDLQQAQLWQMHIILTSRNSMQSIPNLEAWFKLKPWHYELNHEHGLAALVVVHDIQD